MSEHPDLVGILPILLENPESQPVCDRDRKNPDFDICFDKYSRRPKGLCNNYQERGGGAEKLELSSENLDSTPPPKQKKLVLTPLCYVKNNVAPPSHHPPTHTHTHPSPPPLP